MYFGHKQPLNYYSFKQQTLTWTESYTQERFMFFKLVSNTNAAVASSFEILISFTHRTNIFTFKGI